MGIAHLETPTDYHLLRPSSILTAFSVLVVDGNGVEVSYEPVTARFTTAAGETTERLQMTDGAGVARFVEVNDTAGHVEVIAARETTGPIRPAPGARLVIES
jgi:hypothetical protein